MTTPTDIPGGVTADRPATYVEQVGQGLDPVIGGVDHTALRVQVPRTPWPPGPDVGRLIACYQVRRSASASSFSRETPRRRCPEFVEAQHSEPELLRLVHPESDRGRRACARLAVTAEVSDAPLAQGG